MTSSGIEEAYDKIGNWITKGLILESMQLLQQGQWLTWPVDMFTAQSLDQQTQPLQQEWEAILSSVSRSAQLRDQRKALLTRQIHFYQGQIERATQRITHTETALRSGVRYHDALLVTRRRDQLHEQLAIHQAVLSHLQEAHQWANAYLEGLILMD